MEKFRSGSFSIFFFDKQRNSQKTAEIIHSKGNTMIEIDGSFGEGGGQILRSSLTLAALSGKEVHFRNIRARRSKPGLMRQHLACVKAVATIAGGTCAGAELNSQELTFSPGRLRAGEYRFIVGSAGSTILIAQAVLPCLLCADGRSTVVIEGGTHAANAPIFEFFERVYLPCLRRMGAEVSATLEAIGFYPAGGGRIRLEIEPLRRWNRLELRETGALRSAQLTVISHGIDPVIGDDEVRFCLERLNAPDEFHTGTHDLPSPGPGNVMFAELQQEGITELFSVCGDVGTSRRAVGERVADMVNRYRQKKAPVWRFLADQLLLPMAIGAGGTFLTAPPSRHTETNIEVIGKFLEVEISAEKQSNGNYLIEVKP